jgi:thymidylate kinase
VNQSTITRVVTAVFQAWTEAEIPFVVLRNYEKLPYFTNNDIDVLVEPARVREAEETLLAAARKAGFRLHNRAEFATLALYLSDPNSSAEVHFDLFTDLKWRGFDFLFCPDLLEQRVKHGLFFIPRRAHEAATNLLASLIYTGKVKEKYREGIHAGFLADGGAALWLLTASYGLERAQSLLACGLRKDWAGLEAMTKRLRRALVYDQLRHAPIRSAKSLLATGRRLAARWLKPPGLVVVLCGADGCGKSTAARKVVESLSGTFSPAKGRHYHWKPPLFSTRRRAVRGPVSNPHGQPARNAAWSLLYFCFHWLEFFLGAFTAVKPAVFKGGLVLIDRFYYDFFVDPRRYRLRLPPCVARLGYRLLPKPDLVFLLDAPPEVLQSRKQEVPLEETARQRDAYRQLVQTLPCGRVIDATQPPDKVAADIKRQVLDFLAERTAARSS